MSSFASPGGSSACAVERTGTILCWGANSTGELGNPNGPSDTPVVVTLPASE